jgi:hypothetical protein
MKTVGVKSAMILFSFQKRSKKLYELDSTTVIKFSKKGDQKN